MHNWYKAVCDTHKTMRHVMVNDPVRTMHLLGDEADEIKQFLLRHFACNLRLIHRDDELDVVIDSYTDESRP